MPARTITAGTGWFPPSRLALHLGRPRTVIKEAAFANGKMPLLRDSTPRLLACATLTYCESFFSPHSLPVVPNRIFINDHSACCAFYLSFRNSFPLLLHGHNQIFMLVIQTVTARRCGNRAMLVREIMGIKTCLIKNNIDQVAGTSCPNMFHRVVHHVYPVVLSISEA